MRSRTKPRSSHRRRMHLRIPELLTRLCLHVRTIVETVGVVPIYVVLVMGGSRRSSNGTPLELVVGEFDAVAVAGDELFLAGLRVEFLADDLVGVGDQVDGFVLEGFDEEVEG